MNSKKHNKKWYSDISPIVVILVLAIPLLILGATTFSAVNRINTAKQNIAMQKSKVKDLKVKYSNLNADKTAQKIEQFNLQGKEEKLSKTYKDITNELYANPNYDWFHKNGVSKFVPYFGKDESKDLANQILKYSILKGNNDVNITFSDFDMNSKTIMVHIFLTYTLDPDLNVNKTGSAYMEVKYDFNSKTGHLESSYIKDNEDSDESN